MVTCGYMFELPYSFMVTCVVTCLVKCGTLNGYMLSMNYKVNVFLCVWSDDGYMLATCCLCDKKS